MTTADSILVIEDDEIDRKSITRAFKELKISNPKHEVCNGKEALEFLRSKTVPKPCLILLDINMPQMNGIEFLQVVKNDEDLKMIPVVMLTTSQEDQDRLKSYKLGIAGYMLKPVDYKQFVEVMRTIHVYWIASLCPPAA